MYIYITLLVDSYQIYTILVPCLPKKHPATSPKAGSCLGEVSKDVAVCPGGWGCGEWSFWEICRLNLDFLFLAFLRVFFVEPRIVKGFWRTNFCWVSWLSAELFWSGVTYWKTSHTHRHSDFGRLWRFSSEIIAALICSPQYGCTTWPHTWMKLLHIHIT